MKTEKQRLNEWESKDDWHGRHERFLFFYRFPAVRIPLLALEEDGDVTARVEDILRRYRTRWHNRTDIIQMCSLIYLSIVWRIPWANELSLHPWDDFMPPLLIGGHQHMHNEVYLWFSSLPHVGRALSHT